MIDLGQLAEWLGFACATVVMPPILIGLIRKIKARLQGRVGAPILQPLFDLAKLSGKHQILSANASWVFSGSAAASVAVALLVALWAPWAPVGQNSPHLDLFLFIYSFALLRFLAIVAALDTSSPFGSFAASREITLAVLVEPAVILSLTSLGIAAKTSDMTEIFAYTNASLSHQSGLWLLAGLGLYIASLVELSRMPADDPTTHLELTMVHEAMIVERSGPNLALAEFANGLKLLVLMGISSQCMTHAISPLWNSGRLVQVGAGLTGLVALVAFTALTEACAVKLRWTKLPEFISYAVTFGLLCAVFVLGV